MGIKSLLAKPFARWELSRIRRRTADPIGSQNLVFRDLMEGLSKTQFGRDHGVQAEFSPAEYRQAVSMRDYEALRPYIDQIKAGASDVLWPGKPAYFAKTSGTTSGSKFIPLTKDSIPNHIGSARAALLSYIYYTGKSAFADGKMIFLQGSPVLTDVGGIPTGRLSGLVYHHVPAYLLRNRKPSYETNCIEDWETKVEAICQETMHEDMSLISGIPPWVIMYFERLLELSGRDSISELFPSFKLFVYGGVNYAPYAARMQELIGAPIDLLETYPASEGFIAYQDKPDADGLLLNVYSGIWFEFVPADKWDQPDAPRLSLDEVEIGPNYALIINNNAGLWSYQIGDTIRFTSLDPVRIKVSGRTQHFISAFGEHVIVEEVEDAVQELRDHFNLPVMEFTVAPDMGSDDRTARHQWFIEFGEHPGDLKPLSAFLDEKMCHRNSYYRDLIDGGMLAELEIIPLKPGSFKAYQKAVGKLGGQNKVARLANDRRIADPLSQHMLSW
jgi:hypothetical protein